LGSTGCMLFKREGDPLRGLRQRLTSLERQRLRELGRTLTLAVEATCRNFDRGEREADVAGHLAHRLLREGVVPVDLRVASDDRLARFRQPTFKAAPIPKVFRRAKRIYEKFNAPHEWTLDYQGSLIGYSQRESLLTPDSNLIIQPDMAI